MPTYVTKRCSSCEAVKTIGEFYTHPNYRDGIRSWCKGCTNSRAVNWAKMNREKRQKTAKAWVKENHAHTVEYARQWRDNNKAKTSQYCRKYRNNLTPEARARRNAQHAMRRTQRFATDSSYRMMRILRGRFVHALRGRAKHQSAIKLLGCSIKDFKLYIESKWEHGMTWENYGRRDGERCWELDHIMPCAIFDLSKADHQKRCFHFSNFQPLWAEHNRAKRDKIVTPQMPLI